MLYASRCKTSKLWNLIESDKLNKQIENHPMCANDKSTPQVSWFLIRIHFWTVKLGLPKVITSPMWKCCITEWLIYEARQPYFTDPCKWITYWKYVTISWILPIFYLYNFSHSSHHKKCNSEKKGRNQTTWWIQSIKLPPSPTNIVTNRKNVSKRGAHTRWVK